MTVVHTHFYIVVDTQRGCHTLQKSHNLSPNLFLNHLFYEIMWKSTVKPERPQIAIKYEALAWHVV